MKYFKILAVLVLTSMILLYSCNDTAKKSKEENTTPEEVKDTATEAAKLTPPLKEPAQNAAGVWHYTCRIGCPGGAGTAAKCKTCSNILVHNTTYHDNATNATNGSNSPVINPSTTPAKPEPAQNTAGVWHYTCSKGCVGGSGSAGTCATCDGPLTHNTAYH